MKFAAAWPKGITAIACLVASTCGGESGKIERTIENGIEVVQNHLVPYRLPGEPSRLVLEEEFRIDAERPDLAAAGLADIRSFDVDSRGFIYLVQNPRKADFLLLQLDARGALRKAFGKKGQGPGELQWPTLFNVNSRDELLVWDGMAKRSLVYDPSANLIQESSGLRLPLGGLPLENGHFLVRESQERPDGRVEGIAVDLVSPDFTERKTIQTFRFPDLPAPSDGDNAFPPQVVYEATKDRIFLGRLGAEYEVLVFDLEGRLLRKIRKDYIPVPLSTEEKNAFLNKVVPKRYPYPDRISFPAYKPAFQYFFADEAGRLFVTTTEKDKETGRNICDIFNPDGAFIGRSAVGGFDILRQYWEGFRLDVVANRGRLYVLGEKESGFKELVVFKAIWR